MEGTGSDSTVTSNRVEPPKQPLVSTYATATVWMPVEFQVTVTKLTESLPPAVMVPPLETTHW